jgi:hypothetical protein
MNINKNIMYKKVSVEEELPPIDEFVVCFYDTGETVIYKRVESSIINIKSDNSTDWSWIARDSPTVHTPEVRKITHWLTEINSSTKEINTSIEEKDYSHITEFSQLLKTMDNEFINTEAFLKLIKQENNFRELAKASIVLISNNFLEKRKALIAMPDDWDNETCLEMVSKIYVERLVIARALITAEIDRCFYKKNN